MIPCCFHRFTLSGRWLALLAAFLVSLVPVAYADGPDEEYLAIFDVIGQADSLSEKGETDRAKAKYFEAQKKLTDFRNANPTWNPNLITHRLKYVSGKLGAQVPKVSAPSTVTPASSNSEAAGFQGAAPRSEVKILSSGAEPRVELRLRPKVGDRQSATMEITMSMDMGMGGGGDPIQMPVMKIMMDTEVTDVSADGDISFKTELTDATAKQSDGAQIDSGMAARLDGIKGQKLNGKISNRGVTISENPTATQASGAKSRGPLDQMQDFMSQATLPEQPVGVGAKWEVERPSKAQGMSVIQRQTCEITSITGDLVTIKTTATQRASNQKVSNPMMPNIKVDLKKLQSSGRGTVVMDLAKVMPVKSEAEQQTEMVMSMNLGGQKQDMTTKMGMKLKLESK